MKKQRFLNSMMVVVLLLIACKYTTKADSHVHNWVEYYRIEASCARSGTIFYECSICHEEETETIPATGIHEWSKWHLDQEECQDGTKTRSCNNCGEEETVKCTATKSHSWKESLRDDADCMNNGKIYYSCTRCGEDKTKTIKSTGKEHNLSLIHI